MLTDFAEVVLVAVLVTTFFFGGWQVPYLYRDGFHLPWGTLVALPNLAVALLGVIAFMIKVVAVLLAANPDSLDAASLPLRPADAPGMERPCCRSVWPTWW